jgi:signal transduction histidine kinase
VLYGERTRPYEGVRALATQLRDGLSPADVAREEERLRLRRDLHDGIGPTLAGVRLQWDTARAALPPDSPATTLLRKGGLISAQQWPTCG